VQQAAHTIAQHSYTRCLRAPDFFEVLYDRLLKSHPAIPPMFAHTQFPKQHKLLQHGLGLLLSYAKKPDPALLERIAARHSAGGADVKPEMYPYFMDALLHAVRSADPNCDAEVEEAWREAMRPGVEFMQARYES
jgi:hemoglobin-like flavoprotein